MSLSETLSGWPRGNTRRIGVVSDTHQKDEGWDSPPELIEALQSCDLILHCGDLDALGVLDHLETVAPVLAVRGYADPREPGDRLAETTRVVEFAGFAHRHGARPGVARPAGAVHAHARVSARRRGRAHDAEVRPAGGRRLLRSHPR